MSTISEFYGLSDDWFNSGLSAGQCSASQGPNTKLKEFATHHTALYDISVTCATKDDPLGRVGS